MAAPPIGYKPPVSTPTFGTPGLPLGFQNPISPGSGVDPLLVTPNTGKNATSPPSGSDPYNNQVLLTPGIFPFNPLNPTGGGVDPLFTFSPAVVK